MGQRTQIAFEFRLHCKIVRNRKLYISSRRFGINGAAVRFCYVNRNISVKALNVNGFASPAEINQSVNGFRFYRAAPVAGKLNLPVGCFSYGFSAVKCENDSTPFVVFAENSLHVNVPSDRAIKQLHPNLIILLLRNIQSHIRFHRFLLSTDKNLFPLISHSIC